MRRVIFAGILALALNIAEANATPLVITNVGGLPGNGWFNPSAGADAIQNQSGQLTDSIFWGGVALSQDSGYQFTPGSPAVPLVFGTPFPLGMFTHINNPVSTAITDVQYALGFETNGSPGAFNTVFNFTNVETDNFGQCPSNPVTGAPSVSTCDDFVTVANLILNGMIVSGSDHYFFNLLGFSTDGAQTFTNVFQTQESQMNSATLYGLVTAQPITPVPEPASLMLVGSGLAIAAARRWRARRSRLP